MPAVREAVDAGGATSTWRLGRHATLHESPRTGTLFAGTASPIAPSAHYVHIVHTHYIA